jgi:hypothetical protein
MDRRDHRSHDPVNVLLTTLYCWEPHVRSYRMLGTARARQYRPTRAKFIMLLACVSQCGCVGFGTTRFYEDQVGYSRAVGDAEKSNTLLNAVRIRYGDTPVVLQPTQVISAYQLQRNVNGGFEVFPAANPSTFANGSASAQLQQSPTFTFQPLSGAQFAQSFIQPLSGADLLPLMMGGLPIDVMFRLAVQSVNGLSNTLALTQTGAAGSPDFFLLLRDLRNLQMTGLLSVRLQHETARTTSHPNSEPSRVYFSFATTRDPALLAVVDAVKRLLKLPPTVTEAEVVYGVNAQPGQVAILTRSMLGVLAQLSLQIDVPPGDIARHLTIPTVGNIGLERRPVVIIHSGAATPADVFTSVQYRQTWFWIAEDDFDSKLAFTVLQILLALARTEITPGTIVTIPAR